MGQEVAPELGAEAIRGFTKTLLEDLRALERIIADGMIEADVQRIGAEQEFFLVDHTWRPAPVAMELLDELKEHGFTSELARFNLEANLDPLILSDRCFATLEAQLGDRVQRIRDVAATARSRCSTATTVWHTRTRCRRRRACRLAT